jgi:hypothetical protein
MAKKAAKKKKGARKAAPRRAARKTARKTTRRAAAPAPHISSTRNGEVTMKRGQKELALTPLKAIIKAHIDELQTLDQTDQVKFITQSLERTVAELRSGCGLSMVVP